MTHSVNDNVVSLSDAMKSILLAGEPKKFNEYKEEGCVHGYCG
jgi:hypothetical protein